MCYYSYKLDCIISVSDPFEVRTECVDRVRWRRRQRERQKSYRCKLNLENNNFARTSRFFVHSFPSLYDYDMKMPNFTFYGRRKQATTIFSFFFWTWVWFLGVLSQKNSPPFDKGAVYMTPGRLSLERVNSGSLSWLYICLHDTTTKCHAGASHPGVSSPRFFYRGENFTPIRNLKRNDHTFRCEIGLPAD